LPPYQGRGRRRAYCSKQCRRRAERRLAASAAWAGGLPDAAALGAVDPATLGAVDPATLGAVELDVDEWNRAMRRMR
jgi:hypothetical protein